MAGEWLLGSVAATRVSRPRAVLVAVHGEGEADPEESGTGTELSLTELERLADTDGLTVVDAVAQNRPRPDSATYVGTGKVRELTEAAQRGQADLVIADGELTPGQVRNLEEQVGVRVVDRTALI